MTRLLSVMANWPRRKKASRGVVATQLGLPRPALRKADCVVRDAFLARLINSSLISKGLNASNLRSVRMSAMTYSRVAVSISLEHMVVWTDARFTENNGRFAGSMSYLSALSQHHDQNHAPDREQGIADRVGDSVTKSRNLAFGTI